jgi:hypothetical protein
MMVECGHLAVAVYARPEVMPNGRNANPISGMEDAPKVGFDSLETPPAHSAPSSAADVGQNWWYDSDSSAGESAV